jgi:hypothetical protein
MSTDDGFPWQTNKELIVVPERHQQAIAIFENGDGDIVIRQERDLYQEDDDIIVVHRDNLVTVVDTLESFIGPHDRDANRDGAVTQRRDGSVTHHGSATAASRSRRYRERKKQAAESGGESLPEPFRLAAE